MKSDVRRRVREYCKNQNLIEQGDTVLLGFSGGADSVCLFLMLLELKKEWGLTLVPVHIHHNLRGDEADRDAHFCEEFCAAHEEQLILKSIPVRKIALEQGIGLEEAGRIARYQAFEEIAATIGATKIALAHHKNDQAETVLFQLFRGSRTKGLAGMEPKNGKKIRPLLCMTRAEIEHFLQEQNQTYCTDSTNTCEEYSRNKIRHTIVPAAEEISAEAVAHIAETAAYLSRVEQFLNQETERFFDQAVIREEDGSYRLKLEEVKKSDPLIAERMIYQILAKLAGGKKDITAQAVETCISLCEKQTGRKVMLLKGIVVEKSYDVLIFSRCVEQGRQNKGQHGAAGTVQEQWTEEYSDVKKSVENEPELAYSTEVIERESDWNSFYEKYGQIPKSTYTKWFDYDKIEYNVCLRTPEEADRIVLYEDGRSKRISEFLKEQKVPKERRNKIPVFAEGNKILWIPAIRGSEAYHITEKTKRILVITLTEESKK